MKTLALLALTLPMGGAEPGRPTAARWTDITVAGVVLSVGQAKGTGIGFSGVTAEAPVVCAGGRGVALVRQGLSRDIWVRLTDVDAAELAKAFDLPALLRPRAVGKVGLVELSVTGDRFALVASKFNIPGDPLKRVEASGDLKKKTVRVKAWALGGLIEYDGVIP